MQRRIAIGLMQAVSLLIALTLNLQAASLDSWAWRAPLPNGNSFNGVCYAGGLIVGVGNNATIMTSTNLANQWWTLANTTTNRQNLNAVAYSPDTNVFVAVGNATGVAVPNNPKGGMILTSTDGTNWYSQGWSNANTRNMNAIAYGAGKFVTVGTRANIWSSPDGTNWTQTLPDVGSSYNLNGIAYRTDVGFVAVGDAGSTTPVVYTSADGSAWSSQPTTGLGYALLAITWGYVTNADDTVTTNFVAVGGKSSTAGIVATSPDGTNWFKHYSSAGFDLTSKLNGTAFRPGVGYLAVGAGAVIQYSTDGTNWVDSYSDNTSAAIPGNDFSAATYAPDLGYFIAVGNYGEVQTCSGDGHGGTWVGRFWGRAENMYGVARGKDNFVAVGNTIPPVLGGQAMLLTSSKGYSWKIRTTDKAPTQNRLNNVAYGANVFVAVANNFTIITSEDEGTNWTTQITSAVTATNLTGVSYITNGTQNIFLIAGASGTILTSPDGTNWTTQPSGSSANLSCSCPTYAAGVYVVAGAAGAILTSPNATAWTALTPPITRDINGLAYGSGKFVAACSYGYILTSPDGITWTRVPTPPLGSDNSNNRSYNSVVYVNGQFVMSGSSSTISSAIVTSADGINWTISGIPLTGATFKAIAYTPDTYVGVGNYGMIMQAGAYRPPISYSYDRPDTLTLSWPGGGTLQASPEAAGTYTNVDGAVSPFAITPLPEPRLFYRVQEP